MIIVKLACSSSRGLYMTKHYTSGNNFCHVIQNLSTWHNIAIAHQVSYRRQTVSFHSTCRPPSSIYESTPSTDWQTPWKYAPQVFGFLNPHERRHGRPWLYMDEVGIWKRLDQDIFSCSSILCCAVIESCGSKESPSSESKRTPISHKT